MADNPVVPDIYCDQFSMALSPYGLTFVFSLSSSAPSALPGPGQIEPQVVVRMSLEHAKVMAMLVRRNLKQFELEQLGDPVRVPAGLLNQLKLSEADW